MKTIEDQKKEAKAYRKIVPRRDLGLWEVQTNRPVVEELILRQEKTRLPQLIPERRKRMSVSPFTFFRGAAIIQAHDLSLTPRTDFRVQACGDAHISNFGIFASPERRLLFDINDFDETLSAPFEVDVKRFIASLEICGRDRNFSRECRESVVFEAAQFYRNTLLESSEMGNMEVWYRHQDVDNLLMENQSMIEPEQREKIQAFLDKALMKNSDRAFGKLMETSDGRLRIKSDPPLIVPIRDMGEQEKELYGEQNILKALQIYEESLPEDRHHLFEQYEMLELAHKVVGVGSVGRRAWVLVMMGRENGDPLVLQLKEAERSVLEEFYGASPYACSGQRVVEGQRAIQTGGDIMLGWIRVPLPDNRITDYYVRQLWDGKGTFDMTRITEKEFAGLSILCAKTLAYAHAKTGNRHALAGYLGKKEAFENAMVNYASAYADQNEADYESFLKIPSPDTV